MRKVNLVRTIRLMSTAFVLITLIALTSSVVATTYSPIFAGTDHDCPVISQRVPIG